MTGNHSQIKPMVLIVDHTPLFRHGIRQVLKDAFGEKNFKEADSESDWINVLRQEPVDLVIAGCASDCIPPNPQFSEVREKYPQTSVLVMAENLHKAAVEEIFSSGVNGLLLKNCDLGELQEAIDCIQNGEKYYTSATNQPDQDAALSPVSIITKREMEILKLIFNEHTNPEIAEILSISRRTVDTHRKNLLRKLNVRNTAGLIRFALQNGLLNMQD